MVELFNLLRDNGGKIVSSNDLTVLQIAEARNENRMFVDSEGFGFVWMINI